ncbi:hypothetical protein Godav_027922 [Gossypium davidsonii]|uniref:MULE transposase domain-containing protein n=1 Tax=Gossypium davidsonii TaxID=34287 RepID=A0A7J8RZ45_GOSDV|nr:hypothetical protein [Gossypium davidsonii]
MLAVACLQFGGDGNKGDEVVGSKSDEGEGGEVAGKKVGEGVEGQGVKEGGEIVEGLGEEGDDVDVSKGGESDEGGEEGVGVVINECGESDGGGEEGVRDESGSDSKDENAYLIKVMYLPDGDDDEEFQEARQNVKEVEGETSGKEIDGEGLNDSVGKEEDGNETEYFDSDNHGSILVTKDDDNTNVCRRRSRFPTYNPNSASPHFYIGMLFKYGEQFKSTIRKYSMCCKRELKIIRNEPNRVKIFHDEHNYCVRFRNKMVNVEVIAEHFEATIGDHPKMKLREIQRRVSSEMHVNINMTRCRRAKKTVKDKLVRNFVQEFAMLWDYADELILKNPRNTIKMAVNRFTLESLPHFKRLYVCFGALKRRWKEGCRPILDLDGCFLKGPFKGLLLAVVGKDGNNQMYPVAWANIEGECIDSWAWFLSLLTPSLGMEDAINDILPRVEHRNYARHVLSNWFGRKKANTFEFAFWKVMKSTTEREWKQNKEDLYKLDEGVAKDLFSKISKAWTKAFQRLH